MRNLRKKSQILKNKKSVLTSEVLERCRKLKKQKKGIACYLEASGLGLKQIENVKKQLRKESLPEIEAEVSAKNEIEWAGNLKFAKKYIYNKEDDKYVMYVRAANGNVVLPGHVVRGIKENYSNWYDNDHTINQVARNYQIPRNYLVEIIRILGITHDSEPLTDEQLLDKNVDDAAAELLQKKKFQLYQTFQKASWKETEEAAEKWFRMQEGTYDPFVNFLSTWQPPAYTPVELKTGFQKNTTEKSLLVGLSDIHFGAKSNKSESYRGKGYSSTEAARFTKSYGDSITKLVQERNYKFNECVLVSLGDILHTTGAGFTTKGTMLVHDAIKEEQFNVAFDSIVYLINTLLSVFPSVKVKSVKGNHNDFGDWVLFKALEAYYRTESRIAFDVFQTDHGLFKIRNTLFVASHGYSAEYKGRIPSAGKARESYIANLFLSKPEALIGVNQKVLLTADQHHLEMREYAEFEHYMLSTSVRGDKHSEAMGLNNLARQSCFVLGEEGVSELVYCYNKS